MLKIIEIEKILVKLPLHYNRSFQLLLEKLDTIHLDQLLNTFITIWMLLMI